jgi:hypothetical protein
VGRTERRKHQRLFRKLATPSRVRRVVARYQDRLR